MAGNRRVDLVMIGDSNQRKDGYGFHCGFLKALSDRYGEYATGIGTVTTDGAAITNYERALIFGAYSGAPAELEALYPSATPQPYSYVATGTLNPTMNGLDVYANSPLDIKANLRYWYSLRYV